LQHHNNEAEETYSWQPGPTNAKQKKVTGPTRTILGKGSQGRSHDRIKVASASWQTATGPIPEFRQAQARVAAGTTLPHTLPTHVPGSDPVLSRDEVEHSFG